MIKLHENAELSKKQERIYIEFKNRVTGYVMGGGNVPRTEREIHVVLADVRAACGVYVGDIMHLYLNGKRGF